MNEVRPASLLLSMDGVNEHRSGFSSGAILLLSRSELSRRDQTAQSG